MKERRKKKIKRKTILLQKANILQHIWHTAEIRPYFSEGFSLEKQTAFLLESMEFKKEKTLEMFKIQSWQKHTKRIQH